MTRIQPLDPETTTGAAKPLLEAVKAKLGIDSGTKLLIRAAQWVTQDS